MAQGPIWLSNNSPVKQVTQGSKIGTISSASKMMVEDTMLGNCKFQWKGKILFINEMKWNKILLKPNVKEQENLR